MTYPSHCALAVVGAGWGGAYLAWRMAVDTNTVNASEVCVFEANGRVGGRIYSIHGVPHFGPLAVDVGGYRFQDKQKLPADLVWSALELPTACYDFSCQGGCEGKQNCYVIKDPYGNNAGYATPIETMLGEVEAAGGVGKQVHFGARLTGVHAAPLVSKTAVRLAFDNGQSVTADRAVLNMPGNSIDRLSKSSVIFHGSVNASLSLRAVGTFAMVKCYAYYADAWWNTKLGQMEGYFPPWTAGRESPWLRQQTTAADGSVVEAAEDVAFGANASVPLEGRYHDGPQRCVIGTDTAGEPIYSGVKVKHGNCSGALEVYYGRAVPFYAKYMSSPLQPLTVATREGAVTDSKQAALIDEVHATLMAYHAKKLSKAGYDPTTFDKPLTIVMANWIEDGEYTPGIGRLMPGTNLQRKAVRKPNAAYPGLYVVDQDYGYQSGWAVGSLAMAEKILQAEVGLPKPAWLSAEWYKEWVTAVP